MLIKSTYVSTKVQTYVSVSLNAKNNIRQGKNQHKQCLSTFGRSGLFSSDYFDFHTLATKFYRPKGSTEPNSQIIPA
jgi:hypothetical protein